MITDGEQTRHIESFSRKVTSTANQLIGPFGDSTTASHYQHAMNELHKELRRPGIQRRVFSYAQSSPTELVRARLSTTEIQHRALTFIPDEILKAIPETENVYSLFQGFKASLPEEQSELGSSHTRRRSNNHLLLENEQEDSAHSLPGLKKKRDKLSHRMELLGIRKNLCSSEIREIDGKISNLHSMRKIVLDRLSGLEDEEANTEFELSELENVIEDLQEQDNHTESIGGDVTPAARSISNDHSEVELSNEEDIDSHETFMSASIYEKISTPKVKRHKPHRRKSVPIRHEHFEPGTNIRELPAHSDTITAIDFDAPFGTLVTSALDDTVRVWDLNLGRCIGFLEGHRASVRCLQVEDHIVATGSIDASIRLWDLSKIEYAAYHNKVNKSVGEEHGTDEGQESDEVNPSPSANLQSCQIYSLEAHVDEVTALHHRMNTLISGSADKTLRQWDLVKGRCVQTLDVLWAAAQASAAQAPTSNQWHSSGRSSGAEAAFVGALQCFDAALACGTADGMVRLWDLRSGQVGRSLIGHTGPITSLQFDDTKLVTGSLDRSIRVSLCLSELAIEAIRTDLSFSRFGTFEQVVYSTHMHMITL